MRIIALTVVLILYAGTGLFTRFEADDYCQVMEVNRLGVMGYTVEQYNTWQGRYSWTLVSLLLYDVLDKLSPAVTAVLTIAGMVGAWWYLLHYWIPDKALLLAQALTLSFLAGVPNIWQSVYWMNASLNYTAPVVFSLIFAGWLLRRGVLRAGFSSRDLANSGG